MIQSFPQLTQLTVMDQLEYPRIASLLSQIHHISHLTTAVVQTRPPLDWSKLGLAIAAFLQENTAIRDLEVDICTGGPAIFPAEGNDGWEFLDALAPVKSLTINPLINANLSLTKLVVLEMNFGEVELRQVFGDAELVYLRNLELRLKTIDRQSIEILSKRTVRLERLTLRGQFNDMSRHKPSLVAELSAMPLEWNLKDITIVTDAQFAMTFRTLSFYIMMALAISVPSISQFEGSPERYNAMRWGNDYIALRKGPVPLLKYEQSTGFDVDETNDLNIHIYLIFPSHIHTITNEESLRNNEDEYVRSPATLLPLGHDTRDLQDFKRVDGAA
ncbi:hypothetical protein ONZ45_g14838 [Pleurotus djamor]|nr:hypothetical protein ONZ45_g14838 [Pleurotus djamor]